MARQAEQLRRWGRRSTLGRTALPPQPGVMGEAKQTSANDSVPAAFDDLTNIRELQRCHDERSRELFAPKVGSDVQDAELDVIAADKAIAFEMIGRLFVYADGATSRLDEMRDYVDDVRGGVTTLAEIQERYAPIMP